MLGLDGLRLDTSRGTPLDLDSYRRDFRQRQWTIDGQDSWKLERCQHFREPGFASWEAFDRGEWRGALRLIEEERDYLREFSEENDRRGEQDDPEAIAQRHLLGSRREEAAARASQRTAIPGPPCLSVGVNAVASGADPAEPLGGLALRQQHHDHDAEHQLDQARRLPLSHRAESDGDHQ